MITDLREFLRNEVNTPFLFCLNPGNAGDALIAQAALQTFRELNFEFKIITRPSSSEVFGHLVVYSGGGNLTPFYKEAREFLVACHESAKQLILLPQTITHNEDLLESLGPNTTIFCREPITYAHVVEHAKRARILMAHDMALLINAKKAMSPNLNLELRALSTHFRRFLHPSGSRRINKLARLVLIFISNQLRWFLRIRTRSLKCRQLVAFRVDVERTHSSLPSENLDISRVLAFGCDTEANVYLSTNRILRFVNYFEEIQTNRLHVAIAGALLGKKIALYANCYHKCESVYEFSLKNRFPNMRFVPRLSA